MEDKKRLAMEGNDEDYRIKPKSRNNSMVVLIVLCGVVVATAFALVCYFGFRDVSEESDNFEVSPTPKTDICRLPITSGPCEAYMPRWAFDPLHEECVEFIYGGCEGNENNYVTREDCQDKCHGENICRLPITPGPCKAYMTRWAFDPLREECVEFIYGGCEGNENNYLTREDCQDKCHGENICRLPVTPGPCEAYMPRWAFDPLRGECVEFIYGGCEGNENNYVTREDCQDKCHGEMEDICVLRADVGPCDGVEQRWYWSESSGRCDVFEYGGCEGNGNNFMTKDECESRCGVEDICVLHADVGPCDGVEQRWYWSESSGMCDVFEYGGCEGNGNNFMTKDECERRCGGE